MRFDDDIVLVREHKKELINMLEELHKEASKLTKHNSYACNRLNNPINGETIEMI